MPESVPPRKKKKPTADTARERSARACAQHLEDLKRAHGSPPPDVQRALEERGAPRLARARRLLVHVPSPTLRGAR